MPQKIDTNFQELKTKLLDSFEEKLNNYSSKIGDQEKNV